MLVIVYVILVPICCAIAELGRHVDAGWGIVILTVFLAQVLFLLPILMNVCLAVVILSYGIGTLAAVCFDDEN